MNPGHELRPLAFDPLRTLRCGCSFGLAALAAAERKK
jgi:hypothetical protein